jgi:hypothetical protein
MDSNEHPPIERNLPYENYRCKTKEIAHVMNHVLVEEFY